MRTSSDVTIVMMTVFPVAVTMMITMIILLTETHYKDTSHLNRRIWKVTQPHTHALVPVEAQLNLHRQHDEAT